MSKIHSFQVTMNEVKVKSVPAHDDFVSVSLRSHPFLKKQIPWLIIFFFILFDDNETILSNHPYIIIHLNVGYSPTNTSFVRYHRSNG
jgi:hypothetical protein